MMTIQQAKGCLCSLKRRNAAAHRGPAQALGRLVGGRGVGGALGAAQGRELAAEGAAADRQRRLQHPVVREAPADHVRRLVPVLAPAHMAHWFESPDTHSRRSCSGVCSLGC